MIQENRAVQNNYVKEGRLISEDIVYIVFFPVNYFAFGIMLHSVNNTHTQTNTEFFCKQENINNSSFSFKKLNKYKVK